MKEEDKFRYNVLRAILYFASDGGKKRLPTIDDFLTSEIVSATIEYLTEEEYSNGYRKEQGFQRGQWYRMTNNAMKEAFEKFGNKFNPALGEAIRTATEFHFQSDHGETWHENLFRWFPKRPSMVSTYSLSVESSDYIKEKVIPSLDPDTVGHCKKIAKIMRKYLDQDLEFIKEHYHW